MADSGVRNSCPSTATNSSFARLAASADARAARSRASSALRSSSTFRRVAVSQATTTPTIAKETTDAISCHVVVTAKSGGEKQESIAEGATTAAAQAGAQAA